MTGPFRIFPMDVNEEGPAPAALPVAAPVAVPMDIDEPLNNPLPPFLFGAHPLPAGLGPLPNGRVPHIVIPPLDFANLLPRFGEDDEDEAPIERPGFQYLNDNNGLDTMIRFHNEFQDAVRLQGYNNLDAFFDDLDIHEETVLQGEDGTVFRIHYEAVHRSDNNGFQVSCPDFHDRGYQYSMY